MAVNGSKRHRTRPRGSTIAVVDVGSSKVCCVIARVEEEGRVAIAAVAQQASHGLKSGAIVDLQAASRAIGRAVNEAEQKAGETVREVVANLSAAQCTSHTLSVEVGIDGPQIGEADRRRALAQARGVERYGETRLIHSNAVGYAVDGRRGIEDPRGLYGATLGVQLHAVTTPLNALRTLDTGFAESHLALDAVAVGPYAAALACLVPDERTLGCTLIDMGAETTSIAVFIEGALVFADCVPVGGAHVTNDIARGLVTPVAYAERIKTLYGSAVSTAKDEQDSLEVPQVGEDEPSHAHVISKSILVGIIQPRIEETFEFVRARLEQNGLHQAAGRRVVLTGGACQLGGVRELAALILDKQVRIGRPLGAEWAQVPEKGPGFATAAGLIAHALAEGEEAMGIAVEDGVAPHWWGRVGHWLRQNI